MAKTEIFVFLHKKKRDQPEELQLNIIGSGIQVTVFVEEREYAKFLERLKNPIVVGLRKGG